MKGFLETMLIGDKKFFPSGTIIESIQHDRNEQAQQGLLKPGMTPGKQTKRMLLDINIRSKREIYIIEMQKKIGADINAFLKRIQFYSTVAHSSQQIVGTKRTRVSYEMDYGNCLPVISIVILEKNQNIFNEKVPCVSYHQVLETSTQQNFLAELSWVFVELSKFNACDLHLDDAVKEWLELLTRSNFEDPPHYNDAIVQRAAERVKMIRDGNWEQYNKDYEQELIELEVIESFEVAAKKARLETEEARRENSILKEESQREIATLKATIAMYQNGHAHNGSAILNQLNLTKSSDDDRTGDDAPEECVPPADDAGQGASEHDATPTHRAVYDDARRTYEDLKDH